MTVTADSYESKVSAAIVQMLADSTNWLLITDAYDATDAKAFIVEDDGGESLLAVDGTPIDITAPWAVVHINESKRSDRAWLTFGREGSASVILMLRATAGDSAPDAVRRARNTGGLIAADMQALVGASSSRLLYATFDVGEVVVEAEDGALGADGTLSPTYMVPISITWRDIP
jgi:hypothetical protein